MARAAAAIELSEEEERELRGLLRRPSVPQQQALRARIVLRAAEGVTNTQIAAEQGVSLPTVGLWRRNFCERRLAGLADAPRSGRPRTVDDDEVQRVLAMTLEAPPDGSTHWSVRRLAAATGISPTTVHRIWRDHKLKPHQVRSFKFSKDPQLTEKIVDVVGLYMDPPSGALVLCVDEKTQIQALDRTQPTLPMKLGKAARMRTTTSATARPASTPRWRSRPARSPARATHSTATKSSSRSSTSSCSHTRAGRCTSCSTTPPRTQPPRSSAGCSATSACTFTSRRRAPRG
jgi:transposase